VYGGTVHIASTTTLKARAYKSGWNPSGIASGIYEITGTVSTPTFSPSPGTYTSAQDVGIGCSTSGATIHYTTNGMDPTESSPVYGGTVHIASTTTLKARAYKSGWNPSGIASGIYEITGTVSTPTFSPSPGTYTIAQDVGIGCSTSGATIHYTTNGMDPTESSPVYGGTVHIASTTTLKARAYKSGWNPSLVASVLYTITTGVEENPLDKKATDFHLDQNYPNPFNPETRIRFELPKIGRVNLAVYDIRGNLIRTLVDSERNTGVYEVIWDGKNNAEEKVFSGIYIFRMSAAGHMLIRKMSFVK
jgi:hypothetical protein